MSTATGFRAEWSTKQDFDIYEVFEDVLLGFAEYKFGWVTVRGYGQHSVVVYTEDRCTANSTRIVSSAEELESALEHFGVLKD